MAEPLSRTALFEEIHQQPAVVTRLLREQRGAAQELARAMTSRRITHVVIAARGTSDNAARYAQYALGARNGLLVGLATPSLFTVYGAAPNFHDALVVGISQSGASPDIVAVLAEARRQGALTAVLTNNTASDLAHTGEIVIDLCAGEERAVAATKTYTAELAAIALVSASLSADRAAMHALEQVPEALEAVLDTRDSVIACAARFRYMERSVVIGRGFNYATAFEMALKLKELTYTIVEPYSSADFLHGPLAMMEEGFPAVVIAPDGKLFEEMQALMGTLRSRGAEIACVSDRPEALEAAQVALAVPRAVPEWLSPITMIVPGQLLAMGLAHTRGHDVDAPRAIRKVTRTH